MPCSVSNQYVAMSSSFRLIQTWTTLDKLWFRLPPNCTQWKQTRNCKIMNPKNYGKATALPRVPKPRDRDLSGLQTGKVTRSSQDSCLVGISKHLSHLLNRPLWPISRLLPDSDKSYGKHTVLTNRLVVFGLFSKVKLVFFYGSC